MYFNKRHKSQSSKESEDEETEDKQELWITIHTENFTRLKTLLENITEPKSYIQILSKILQNCKISENTQKAFWIVNETLEKNKIAIDLNQKTKDGKTLLLIAIRHATSDIILHLLKLNASLADKNDDGCYSIDEIRSDTLLEHFDSCIKLGDDQSKLICFKYATLLPAHRGKIDSKEILIPETKAVFRMSKCEEKRQLMNHPLIMCFIYKKWYALRYIFYINIIFYLVFYLSIIIHISFKTPGTRTFLLVTTGLLMARELFRFSVRSLKYFRNFENVLITTLWLLILISDEPNTHVFSAFILLFATVELLFMFGKHPRLIANTIMLRTVSWTYFKFFKFYFMLLFSFAVAFHYIFKDSNKTFSNIFISIFKTLIMTTGEYELSNLELETYPLIVYLLFLFFVIFVSIILLNLMTGLAISDIQMIQSEAKLYAYIKVAEHIYRIEAIFLNQYVRKVFGRFYPILNIEKSVLLFSHDDQTCELSFTRGEQQIVSRNIMRKAFLLVREVSDRKEEETRREKVVLRQREEFEELRREIVEIRNLLM